MKLKPPLFRLSLVSCLGILALSIGSPLLHSETKNFPDEDRSLVKWSTFIDRDVENAQGDDLGKVTELALDIKNGRILAVIVSSGGFMGLGKIMVGVPPGAFTNFRAGREDGTLILDASREKFAAAPRLKMSRWADYFQAEHVALLFRYFDVVPYFQPSKKEKSGMYLGLVKPSREMLGLPVGDGHKIIGSVTAIRVDAATQRLMYVIVTDDPSISSKCEILASEVQLNPAQNALVFDVSKQAGSSFRVPTLDN